MKNILLLFFLLLYTGVTFAQDTIISVNGKKLRFIQVKQPQEDGDTALIMEIKVDGQLLHTLTLNRTEGDCNSIAFEHGTYRIRDSRLVVYTMWDKEGDAPAAPTGYLKRTFLIPLKGKVRQQSAYIYYEEGSPYWEENPYYKELQLLHKPQRKYHQPGDDLLYKYRKTIEKEFKARFVHAYEEDALSAEVRAAFENR